MDYYLNHKLKTIVNEINHYEKLLKELPPGRLSICTNGEYTKWYDIQNPEHKYIPKSNREYAEQLALKRLYEARLKYLKKEEAALRSYIKKCPDDESAFISDIRKCREITELLSPILSPEEKYATWANEPYNTNPYKPDQRKHPSLSGHILRSKSEKDIANALFINKIPFRVEAELSLGKHVIFPDFTILRPKDGAIVYWEHYGMVSDPKYNEQNKGRHDEYIENGFIPTINLIETYETLDYPLTMDIIDDNIKRFLL